MGPPRVARAPQESAEDCRPPRPRRGHRQDELRSVPSNLRLRDRVQAACSPAEAARQPWKRVSATEPSALLASIANAAICDHAWCSLPGAGHLVEAHEWHAGSARDGSPDRYLVRRKSRCKTCTAAGSTQDAERPAVVCADKGDKTSLFAGTLTGATGLEPATSGVTGRRSNQLNYAPTARRPL